ncbi:hypothetical protein I79_005802 [Cricetulus griseus]|uniref:Uncharacterized protein n=1 Tax=Cricetulus griseus TaxID=10029 RepID=G3H652_CRIGR|nr:hypothetical protein I79_005802 [Cricetulus griseus]
MLSSGWGLTLLLECLPSMLGVLYWTQHHISPGMVAYTHHLGIQEVEAGVSRAQTHPQLHEDFKIRLGY